MFYSLWLSFVLAVAVTAVLASLFERSIDRGFHRIAPGVRVDGQATLIWGLGMLGVIAVVMFISRVLP
ncbi:MAG: hypothetical protein IT307_05060 [Chloroflexi bacterium]|nr:hypothetical protein [Chloroflexota bacterium]